MENEKLKAEIKVLINLYDPAQLFQYGVSECGLVSFPKFDIGITQTGGGGLCTSADGGVGVGPLFSNANTIHSLDGGGSFLGGSAKAGAGVGVDLGLSKDKNGNLIYTVAPSFELGLVASPYILPAEIHVGGDVTGSRTLTDLLEYLNN